MKHLGKIEIGGSLDITNNKHVEDLIEEALKGIEFPEDTNTTYTLTQDGLVVQLVDDGGGVVSEVEIPKFEDEDTTYTLTQDGTTIQLEGSEGGSSEVDIASLIPQPVDPYQEVKGIDIQMPTVNLFDTLRSGDYDEFDITSEFDEENSLISIYLHLHIGENIETFTLADNVSNEFFSYSTAGTPNSKIIRLTEVYKDGDYLNWDVGNSTRVRHLAQISPIVDTPLEGFDGGLTIHNYSSTRPTYFVFPDVDEETESEPTIITATLEEHLQNIYGHIYNS